MNRIISTLLKGILIPLIIEVLEQYNTSKLVSASRSTASDRNSLAQGAENEKSDSSPNGADSRH